MAELPSRKLVINQLIRDCLDLAPDGRRRDVPVIALWGPHGSEKTALLSSIKRRCAGVRPCVLWDLERASVVRPHRVAANVAYGLSERVGQFGSIRFPRLLLGLVAIRSDLNRDDGATARAELQGLLFDRRRLRATLEKVADGLFDNEQDGVRTILGFGLDGAVAVICALWVRRSRALAWYRDGTGEHFNDPLDALVRLRSWETDATPRTRADVDMALCAAFLADLRAAFGEGIRARQRTGNCVVLLDNADLPAGQSFLQVLTTARHAARPLHGCDPLLVVAAGHTRFPEFAMRDGREVCPRSPEQATYADWADHRDGSVGCWLYAVQLRGADVQDQAVLVRDWPRVDRVPDAVAVACQLTAGHPVGLRLVLRAISAQAGQTEANAVDLRNVLVAPDPDRPDRTVADAAIDLMLTGMPADLRRDLTTCAAARDIGATSRRHALGLSAEAGGVQLELFRHADLWVDTPDRSGRPVLHPFLRRVLLHALAVRPGSSPDGWQAVHSRLRQYHRAERGDVPASLYHALALADVDAVVVYLDERLGRLDARRWLSELKLITSAPRAAPTDAPAPRDQVAALATPTDTLARLVAAMWISNDPLGDPHGTLDVLIAADLSRVEVRASPDGDVLSDEAHRYRMRRQDWR